MGTTQLETVPEPKYWHLKTVLSEALDSEFAVGEVLPNERDLAARFGVARATLRQALEQLELEGRLQRRRGVGTTVAPPRVGVAVGPARHTWPGAGRRRLAARRRRRGRRAPAAVARLLETAPDEPVHTVRRSRVTHGQPVAAELLYVPRPRCPAARHDRAVSARAAPAPCCASCSGSELEGQDRTVELGSARAEDAKQLDRLPGAPVLVVTTRYFCRAAAPPPSRSPPTAPTPAGSPSATAKRSPCWQAQTPSAGGHPGPEPPQPPRVRTGPYRTRFGTGPSSCPAAASAPRRHRPSTANSCSSTWSRASRSAPVATAASPSSDSVTSGGRRQ